MNKISELADSIETELSAADELFYHRVDDEINRAYFCLHIHRIVSNTIALLLEKEGYGDDADSEDNQAVFYLRISHAELDDCIEYVPEWILDNIDELCNWGRYNVNITNDLPMYDLPIAYTEHEEMLLGGAHEFFEYVRGL